MITIAGYMYVTYTILTLYKKCPRNEVNFQTLSPCLLLATMRSGEYLTSWQGVVRYSCEYITRVTRLDVK